ncbi:MAG: hypothetical protein QOF91_259, partial [Alphaproteobacteria bacterium]|nr:hypothetical protein [Alphaproteobacteria bacterium]
MAGTSPAMTNEGLPVKRCYFSNGISMFDFFS